MTSDESSCRRHFLGQMGFAAVGLVAASSPAFAAATSIDAKEFVEMIRDKDNDIASVQFSGYDNFAVKVLKTDGSTFRLQSVADPQVIVALCDENGVNTNILQNEMKQRRGDALDEFSALNIGL